MYATFARRRRRGSKDGRETFLLYLSTSLFHFLFLLRRATVIWLANAPAISFGIAARWSLWLFGLWAQCLLIVPYAVTTEINFSHRFANILRHNVPVSISRRFAYTVLSSVSASKLYKRNVESTDEWLKRACRNLISNAPTLWALTRVTRAGAECSEVPVGRSILSLHQHIIEWENTSSYLNYYIRCFDINFKLKTIENKDYLS